MNTEYLEKYEVKKKKNIRQSFLLMQNSTGPEDSYDGNSIKRNQWI